MNIGIYLLSLWGCRTPTSKPTLSSTTEDALEDTSTESEYTLEVSVPPHHWLSDDITFEADLKPYSDTTTYHWQCPDGSEGLEKTLTITPSTVGTIECTVTVNDLDWAEPISTSGKTTVHTAPSHADWTILVYLAGDNNLEESAIVDLNEMEQVGSSEQVNIVVELDRSTNFYTGHDNWTGAKRFYVTKDTTSHPESDEDEIVSVELADLGVTDSGHPDTLLDFLSWGVETFPSDKVAVIFWNHGWSWSVQQTTPNKGIMSDDNTGNDISVADGELRSVMDSLATTLGRPIDLLGMDACTMQSWEIATDIAPYCQYFVASQDYVNWDGWAYDVFLKKLIESPSFDGLDLAQTIGDAFYQSGDLTISTIDLSVLPDFNQALEDVANSLLEEPVGLVTEASNRTYSADGMNFGNDHDLFALMSEIRASTTSPSVYTSIGTALSFQNTLIPHNFVNDINGASGLSIYAPPSTDIELDPLYLEGSWAEHPWVDVLWREQNQ